MIWIYSNRTDLDCDLVTLLNVSLSSPLLSSHAVQMRIKAGNWNQLNTSIEAATVDVVRVLGQQYLMNLT